MKKNKIKKKRIFHKSESIFRKWLYENINRFNNKPIPNGEGGFYFEGITKAINLIINYRIQEAMLSFEDRDTKENYDYHSIQYIGNEKYDPLKGFYDADRIDLIYTYYNTYEALIITEVFEPIIEYCNNNFQESNSLYLINYDGSTEGFIAPSDETISTSKLKMLRRRTHQSNRNIQYLKYPLFIQT
jgi:hypothetical protein